MSRLVAVSNRVSIPRRGAAPGGLVVGLMSAMQARGGLWFGWNGNISESATGSTEISRRDRVSYATLPLTQAEYAEFYLGFCNGILWPVFHYFLDTFRYSDAHYDTYLAVNQRFARQLAPLLRSDDLIWVHDYHFLPLAQKLRECGISQPLGLFLHIPFPQIEALRVLPVYRELLSAMLEYDVVGFQTHADLLAFRSAVEHLWGPDCIGADGVITVGNRRTVAAAYPIGIDVDDIQAQASTAQSGDQCRRMIRGLLGRKLLIGVDRLDYSKGLVPRFRAYERFLETHPDNQNKVTYLQIAPLSRADVHAYSLIRSELEQAAGRTNGRFAETDWTPIRYLNRNFPHDVLMGFMRSAPVALVTPVRDGMNLVAKEFVAAQDPEDPGVLILSTLAGAACELTASLQVNPYDTRGIASAIQQALTMSLPERRSRHRSMIEVLRTNDIQSWHTRFLQQLAESQRRRGIHTQP